MPKHAARALLLVTFGAMAAVGVAQTPADGAALSAEQWLARARAMSERANERGLAEPFKGITTDGELVPGLFEIRSTHVSTEPVRAAAAAFVAALSDSQRARTLFPIDSDEWRKWMNPHFYVREGVSFGELDAAQTLAAFGMLAASLSAKGLEQTRDIMHLNTTLAELNGDNFLEYGEDKYHITIMGTPSASEPWGWQLEGHHLAINYFVLGEQVVMTPAFWGSEPAVATAGKYAGTKVLVDEQTWGLEMIRALDDRQRATAVLSREKNGNNAVAQAFSDNVVLDYAGIRADALSAPQRELLRGLIGLWVSNLGDDQAQIQMTEINAHFDATYFAWIGGVDSDSVFYYRIQSPVILIEFDHQTPVGLTQLYPRGVPYREHVHAVVRTPNGNDYGKDLLRQHLTAVRH